MNNNAFGTKMIMAIDSKMSRRPIGSHPEKKTKKSGWMWILLVVGLVVIGGVWYQYKYLPSLSAETEQAEEKKPEVIIDTGEYQAVFLDNGQVYFGKLQRSRSDFYALTDVYYLQTGAVDLDQNSNLSIAKLGNEAHGPEDKMDINVDHILFIENMKSDSKVVKAIQSYKNK